MNQTSIIPGDSSSANSGGLDLDLSGRQLGDYRLLRRLGRGAMADVYLAEQGSLRRQVAFKVLKRELAADDSYVRRFHMEAQAAAALVHANIVQIYEVGCIDGVHYIAQEYVEGQNLGQLLARRGTPEVKLAVAIVRQVASALCKSAERGIVHRDIKPENIMLGRTGEVKVADFGLARVTAADDTNKLTQVGITMGTPLYMSPEQVEGRPLDPRSDLYSLGVTCYHMLTGQPPFRGDTALSVALQHVRTQPERLENVRPELPPALCRIVHKMLAKDPAERFQNPRELLRELRELVKEGDEFQWPADLDEFDTVEMASLAMRGEATQRLQTLMRVESRRSGYRWMAYVAAPILAALLLGAGVAWALREPYILNVPPSKVPQVPKFDTAELQFQYAYGIDPRIETWKAVIDNFATDERYTPLAKRELAKAYLQSDSKAYRAEAMKLFTELAEKSSDIEKESRAFGIAGQAIVYSLENKPDESAQKLAEFIKIAGTWDSGQAASFIGPDMAQTLAHVVQRNRKAIGDAKASELENWLQQHFSDEAE